MIWKVYAQNVVRPKGMAIVELHENELNNEFDKAAMELLNTFDYSDFEDDNGEISDKIYDDICNAIYELIKKHWHDYNYLEMCDYMLKKSDEMPNRPNRCGCINSLFSVEEIKNHLT